MRTLTCLLVFVVSALCGSGCTQSLSAAEDNAGGLDAGVVCDDPNAVSCESICVDTDVNPDYCGSCDTTCSQGQGCSAGSCVDLCEPGFVNCDGECIDPLLDAQHCGANGTCTGDQGGLDCGTDQCSAGVCVQQRYLGSLPASTGRWNYGGSLGFAGAEAMCQSVYGAPTATVCSKIQMLDAQAQGELVNATDNLQNPVDAWHLVDAAQNNLLRQCVNVAAENIPWTYETAHLGQGAKYITLDRDAGTISEVQDGLPSIANGCGAKRFVPCCLP